MLNYTHTIAFRYLLSKKRDSFISVISIFSLIGVALGVAALIVVMAVMNGFHYEISNKMMGFNGDISIYGFNGYIENYLETASNIKKQEKEVTQVFPVIEGQVMALSNNVTSGSLVKGISLEDLKAKPLISQHIIDGNIDDFKDNGVIVGNELAVSLGLNIGSKVTLISPQGYASVIGMVPRIKAYDVVGIFKSDMYQYDSTTIFMPLSTAQIYFKLPQKVNLLEVMVKDPYQTDVMLANLNSITQGEFRITDWQTTNRSYFQVLKTERVVMFVILSLIILVAALNITSSLVMLVKDKTKDIAILRAMGASARDIDEIFAAMAGFIGIIGTTLGVIIGVSFSANIEKIRQLLEKATGNKIFDPIIYYLSALPARIEIEDVAWVVFISFILCGIASIYPARKASSLDPIQGLRYE